MQTNEPLVPFIMAYTPFDASGSARQQYMSNDWNTSDNSIKYRNLPTRMIDPKVSRLVARIAYMDATVPANTSLQESKRNYDTYEFEAKLIGAPSAGSYGFVRDTVRFTSFDHGLVTDPANNPQYQPTYPLDIVEIPLDFNQLKSTDLWFSVILRIWSNRTQGNTNAPNAMLYTTVILLTPESKLIEGARGAKASRGLLRPSNGSSYSMRQSTLRSANGGTTAVQQGDTHFGQANVSYFVPTATRYALNVPNRIRIEYSIEGGPWKPAGFSPDVTEARVYGGFYPSQGEYNGLLDGTVDGVPQLYGYRIPVIPVSEIEPFIAPGRYSEYPSVHYAYRSEAWTDDGTPLVPGAITNLLAVDYRHPLHNIYGSGSITLDPITNQGSVALGSMLQMPGDGSWPTGATHLLLWKQSQDWTTEDPDIELTESEWAAYEITGDCGDAGRTRYWRVGLRYADGFEMVYDNANALQVTTYVGEGCPPGILGYPEEDPCLFPFGTTTCIWRISDLTQYTGLPFWGVINSPIPPGNGTSLVIRKGGELGEIVSVPVYGGTAVQVTMATMCDHKNPVEYWIEWSDGETVLEGPTWVKAELPFPTYCEDYFALTCTDNTFDSEDNGDAREVYDTGVATSQYGHFYAYEITLSKHIEFRGMNYQHILTTPEELAGISVTVSSGGLTQTYTADEIVNGGATFTARFHRGFSWMYSTVNVSAVRGAQQNTATFYVTPKADPQGVLDPLVVTVQLNNPQTGLPEPGVSVLACPDAVTLTTGEAGEPVTFEFDYLPAIQGGQITVQGNKAEVGSSYLQGFQAYQMWADSWDSGLNSSHPIEWYFYLEYPPTTLSCGPQ